MVNRSHTDEQLDALFGEEVEESRPQHDGNEQPADPRANKETLTRRAFLLRWIRTENS